MSKFYAAGLRRLADALEAEPIKGESYEGIPSSFQINVGTHLDVIAAAARFGVAAQNWGDGAFNASVDFGGVTLNVYANVEATK